MSATRYHGVESHVGNTPLIRLRRPLLTGGSGFICIRLNRPFKLSKSQLGQIKNEISMIWTKSVLLPACPKILQDVRKLDISDGTEVRQVPRLLPIHAHQPVGDAEKRQWIFAGLWHRAC
jgi:hypothetical protein